MLKDLITFILIVSVYSTSLANSNHHFHHPQQTPIKAILFDTVGTVVDWRSSMVNEFQPLFKHKDLSINAESFVEGWVNAYAENIEKISTHPENFKTVDELNDISLDNTLKKYRIFSLFSTPQRKHMSLVWHRLKPWPDSVAGLNQLKKHFIIGTLTNGNIKLVIDLSKKGHLNWDVIFSGEFVKRYKPDPVVYQSAAKFLNLYPSQILLVASHKFDLNAAKKLGFKTAYLFRPKEFQTVHKNQFPIKGEFDFTVTGIDQLAIQLTQYS